MKIIVGLGNPGREYEGTRHNAGFVFVDRLSTYSELSPAGEVLSFKYHKKYDAEIAEVNTDGEKIILVKPQTYMNLSGSAVEKILSYYKADLNDLIVVADDKDLPIGQARVRKAGGSAGQKGLQNIIDSLKTNEFTRIRIGISEYSGNASEFDQLKTGLETADFVLSQFSDREKEILSKIVDETIHYILPYLGRSKQEQLPDHTISVAIQ